MNIHVKLACEPAASSDGYRVLIDRLTLVYFARENEHNDAVVLAEVLRRGLPKTRKQS